MRGLIALLLIGAASPAAAQTMMVSPGPDAVSVTVYRAPDRAPDQAIDRGSPQGFALITETRTIAIPAGPSVIRFEGVAGNIFPESAIVAGLPAGVREKNLDADLLSPRSLFDRALGRRVLIRRTDPTTGKVREEQAVIRSSADGAAVLQVGDGYEALRCTGGGQALVYDGVPAGLSAKPTLSIATDSPKAARATITLSYLAGGFDWQADYVVTMRPGGRSADLFAWVTLASNDVTSFVAAGTQVVAGKPNRVGNTNAFGQTRYGGLALQCFASGPPGFPDSGTSERFFRIAVPPPPPPPPPQLAAAMAQDIVVTGAKRVAQEELGDFKLYRIPGAVTVAAKAQKQVALLEKTAVPLDILYVSQVFEGSADHPVRTLRAKNRNDKGLGLPLPSGRVAVFEQAAGRPILVGEASSDDKAIGEDVEYQLGTTPGVSTESEMLVRGKLIASYQLTVSNANPWPISYEAKIRVADQAMLVRPSARLVPKDGAKLWQVTVPANGRAVLTYQVREPR